MKKILFALAMVCLCSCSNNITNPEVDEPTNEPNNETKTETPSTNGTLDGETSNCLINISVDGDGYSLKSIDCIQLNSLTIKDKNGKVVGTGKYWGSYYVPYDGTLTINWKHRDDYTSYGEFTATWANSEYTFNVASAHTLDVIVYNDDYECYIKIGGSSVASFEH
jgi:hypothetical protein